MIGKKIHINAGTNRCCASAFHGTVKNGLGQYGLFAVCVICYIAGCAMAIDVSTDDGLALSLGPGGEILSCRIDGHELLQTGVSGGMFVADVQDIPAREDLLGENLGFEQIEAGNPVGWRVGPNWEIDRQVAHSGVTSIRVTVPDTGTLRSGPLAIEVPVQPNTPYRVGLWLRTEGCAPAFYIEQYDAEGRSHRDYPQITVSHGRKNDDWFQLSRSFTTAFFCRRIRVYCNVWDQAGTAWVDDVSIVCLEDDYLSPQRLATGTVSVTADHTEQLCDLDDLSLRLETVYRAEPDMIIVDGEVEDTSGTDRAVTVSFRLPIDASGWTWFDDIQNDQVMEDGARYGTARLLGEKDPTQRRTIALYPFAALGNGATALALAVPMDAPRAFRLCYDSERGFFVNYEFGLSQATEKFPGKATFQFCVYRIDPQWGFRSAAQRYYESHPEYFVKRVEREGSLGGMLDLGTIAPSDVVIPVFVDFDWQNRERVPAHRRELAKVLRYTEFTGWWGWAIGIRPAQAEQQPTPEQAWHHVEELANGDPPNEVALCLLNCALHDRDGRRRLHWDYQPQWGGYNYLCNPDPEIVGIGGGQVNRYTLTYDREVSEVARYNLDGMRYDNPIVFATDNFRREHFQWADHPLVFDHHSKRPVLCQDFSAYECARAIANDMHAQGKLVGSNYTPAGYPSDLFRIELLDVIESETLWTWPTNAKLALQRTLAGQKTVCMSAQEAKRDWPLDRIEAEMKQAMFYGTFYYLSSVPELHNRWMPLTQRLAKAGWEPITHAWCPALEPMVERFGRRADRNLHFTLRNETDETRSVDLILDAAALGLDTVPHPDVWLMRDAHTPEPLVVDRTDTDWRVGVSVSARDTAVVRVATPFGLAFDRLDAVRDALRKSANYREALRDAGVAAAYPDYEGLIESVQIVQEMLRGPEVEAMQILTRLQTMERSLAGLDVFATSIPTVDWSVRLSECTAEALSGISAAVNVLSEQ